MAALLVGLLSFHYVATLLYGSKWEGGGTNDGYRGAFTNSSRQIAAFFYYERVEGTCGVKNQADRRCRGLTSGGGGGGGARSSRGSGG